MRRAAAASGIGGGAVVRAGWATWLLTTRLRLPPSVSALWLCQWSGPWRPLSLYMKQAIASSPAVWLCAVAGRWWRMGCGRADYEDEADDGSIATIIAHMAGGAAEHVLTGRIDDGLAGDQAQIEAACTARDLTQDECDQLWRTTCALVRANETSIRLIAEELQRRRALSGEEIDAIAWPRS
jgi:hypothetical protein